MRAGLLRRGAAAAADELELALARARAMRESIRGLLEAGDADLTPLRQVADGHAARLTVGEGGALSLAAAASGAVGDALFQLLLIIRAALKNREFRARRRG